MDIIIETLRGIVEVSEITEEGLALYAMQHEVRSCKHVRCIINREILALTPTSFLGSALYSWLKPEAFHDILLLGLWCGQQYSTGQVIRTN